MHDDIIESARRRGMQCLIMSWDPLLEPKMTDEQRAKAEDELATLRKHFVEGGRPPNKTVAQFNAQLEELGVDTAAPPSKKRK